MAQTYSSTPVLSVIKLPNGNSYYLKDADARAILDQLGSAAFENADTDITNGTGVAKTQAIKAYVDQAVAVGIQLVVDTQAQGKEEPATAASASTMGKIYLVAIAGTKSGTYTEFITLDKGTEANPRYVWEKIGTTETDLSAYVKSEDLGAMAWADTASGTLSNGAASVSATYTPQGTISDITVIDSTGTLPTLGEATTSTFAKTGVNVALDTTDPEMLVFSAATTDNAVTAQGTFSQGTLPTTKTVTPTFSGTEATINSTGTATGSVTVTPDSE